jgi:putative nucleotidyltransferase with HDIG domain
MHITLTPAHARLIARLSTFADAKGITAWATGGFLRDYILGTTPSDIDATINADPLMVGPDLAAELNARFVVLDAERRHVRLVLRRSLGHIDLMPLRAANIEADLRLRDYTINALATPVGDLRTDFNPIDPTNGLHDLRRGVVRTTSEQCLLSDPLRLLRGGRIANQLGFTLAAATQRAIKRHSALVSEASPERQREELMSIFATNRAAGGIRLLDELGLLSKVIPELDVARGVEQPKEHHYDVFNHGLAALEYMDVLLAESDQALPAYDAITDPTRYRRGLREGLGSDIDAYLCSEFSSGTVRRAIIKLCALLHDIGKPATKSFEGDGRMRFFGHSEAGAKLAARLMRRLRFPARQVKHVRKMIEAHLRPIQMAQDGAPSRRAVYKFFRDTGDAGVDTMLLSLGDHLATTGPRGNIRAFNQHVALIAYVLQVRSRQEQRLKPVRLVTGRDLMSSLGVDPGAQLGRLLESVREAHATGEIHTREEAIRLAERLLERERSTVAQ